MTKQACPNCHVLNDTGVYVSGQRHRCVRCGISFEVRRTDAASSVQRAAVNGGPAPVPSPFPETTAPARGRNVVVPLRPVAPLAPAEPPEEPVPAPPAADEALEGTVIRKPAERLLVPGFELLELLGRGGMGEVWRARQNSLGRTVAVKLLPPKLAQDPEFVARFAKEATALAALNHPNIVQIIDRGVASEHYYFVMEYVAGRSLRELMTGERVPAAEALKIVVQVCEAMGYAHEQHIIHRDLKPDNILLDERGHVKVADFGLAGIQRQEADAPQLTVTAVAMGTVNYMAPEQRRDAKHVDGRADLYSLGVMLYELLVGELPLGRFRLPSERDASLDPRLDAVVSRLLEPDPAARYATAAQVLAELVPLLASSSSQVHLAGLGPRTPRPGGALPETTRLVQQGGAQPSVVEKGWRGFRNGLMVVGLLAVLGTLVRMSGGRWDIGRDGVDVEVGKARLEVPLHLSHGHAAAGALPTNTDGELLSTSSYRLAPDGRADLRVDFAPGGQEVLHAHAGAWSLERGALTVTQAGNHTTGTGPLIPRAYVDDRVFSSDDFSAEVEMTLADLEKDDFPADPEALRFGELAFRLDDVQVSAFADPETGMRLAWRYPSVHGDQTGNSAKQVQAGLADVVPVPTDRSFKLKLTLHRAEGGILAEASVDDQVFATHLLPGMGALPGKVALGCRNMHCSFQSLTVRARPGRASVTSDTPDHERAER